MVFPFVAEKTFPDGLTTEWDSEVDTQSKLNVRHYPDLLTRGGVLEAPFRGGYAAHIDLSLGTADAYLQEDDDFDIALAGSLSVGFYVWVNGLTMAASDRFTILTLQSTGPVDEIVVDIRNNAGDIQILASETNASATVRAASLGPDAWHHVALNITLDDGASDNGTIDFFLDGRQVGTQITGLDQAAVIQGRWGAMNIDAGTTAGNLMLDDLTIDDTQLFPVRERFSERRVLTKSGLAFRGTGRIIVAALMAGAAIDGSLILFDTDEANTNDPGNIIIPELRNVDGANETVSFVAPWYTGSYQRGCFVSLAGTNPRAYIEVTESADSSRGSLQSYARQRLSHGPV